MAFSERYVTAIGGGGNGLTEPTAFTWAQAKTDWAGSSGQGKRYNIKADGTYSLSGFQDIANSGGGNAAGPVYLRGYKTVIGDGYLGRTNGNGPLILTNMPVFQMSNGCWYGGARMFYESINFQGQGDGEGLLNAGNYSVVVACRFDNNAVNNGGCLTVGESSVAFECDLSMPGTSTSNSQLLKASNAGYASIDACRIISACAAGGISSERHTAIHGCLIKGNGTGTGINVGSDTTRNPFIRNNTIIGWTDGIKVAAATDWPCLIAGNIITDCSGYGVNLTAGTAAAYIGPNRTRDNALGDFNGTLTNWQLAGRIFPLITSGAGTSDYVSVAGGDFNLVSGSPARGANNPQFLDLGAYDHQDPSGGGGSAVFHPLHNFIIRPA